MGNQFLVEPLFCCSPVEYDHLVILVANLVLVWSYELKNVYCSHFLNYTVHAPRFDSGYEGTAIAFVFSGACIGARIRGNNLFIHKFTKLNARTTNMYLRNDGFAPTNESLFVCRRCRRETE